MACVPPVVTETSCVEGVQPDETPAHVSRTNASAAAFVSLATKFEADDTNVTYRPSALIEGKILSPLAEAPPIPVETSVVEGVQPDATPRQVSVTKIFCVDPGTSVTPSVEASTNTA